MGPGVDWRLLFRLGYKRLPHCFDASVAPFFGRLTFSDTSPEAALPGMRASFAFGGLKASLKG